MSKYTVHTSETAPAAAQRTLDRAEKGFGFVPNLLGVFAEAPAALDGYMAVSAAFQKTSFTPAERQTVLLATSVENDCSYCVGAHTTIAIGEGVPADILRQLRAGESLTDSRLEALRTFTLAVVRERGWVGESDIEAFIAAGFTRAQVLEVVLGVTQKTLSNYVSHIAEPPLDAAFEAGKWAPKSAKDAA